MLTLRGTPFLFAGEELGLEDADIPPTRAVDPGGRDGCRAPVPWDPEPAHGWAGGPDPWLPWPPGADDRMNVASQLGDPDSMLHLYRRILEARHSSPALARGTFRWLASPEDTLVFIREEGDDARLVAINFGEETGFELPEPGWVTQIRSQPGEPPRAEGPMVLRRDEAVVLERPRTG